MICPYQYDPTRPNRRSIRLQGYDYTQAGAYFITLCTQDRACLFGEVVDGKMRLNEAGKIAERCWLAIPDHFPRAESDVFVVMPNHVHGIVVLNDPVGATHASPLPDDASPLPDDASPLPDDASRRRNDGASGRPRGPQRRSIASIIGSFKSAVSKRINEIRNIPGLRVWQRNYHEHIIRNDATLNRIREYILANPARWAFDRENPNSIGAGLGPRAGLGPAPTGDEPWRI